MSSNIFKDAGCQPLKHQICLKLLDMICLAINYFFVKKKIPYISPLESVYFPISLYRSLLLEENTTV